MKQFIILISMIVLGILMVVLILGDNGILQAMKGLWESEISIRNMQIVGP